MRRPGRLTRWAAVAVLVIAPTLPALGANLALELEQLATAIAARIAQSSDAKETKKLGKAEDKIQATNPGSADSRALLKILGAVFGSKTVDTTVLDEAQDVLDCLRVLADDERLDAEGFIELLDAKFAKKLQAKIGAGDKKLDAGVALIQENPKKAAKLFHVAILKYVKSSAFAQKALDRQSANGPCGKLSDKIRMVASVKGVGVNEKFSEFASAFADFGQITVLGCDAVGPEGTCRTTLSFTVLYDMDSRATGELPRTFVSYAESSNFGDGTGPGVQDLRWSGSNLRVEIVQSTSTRIKGCFSGQATAEGAQEPSVLAFEGSFVIKRPR